MPDVVYYIDSNGTAPVEIWLASLRDGRARARIAARIDRLRAGNRGDWKSIGGPLFELRIDHGPGYRLYCGQRGENLVLLLCGGDKRTQANDIEKAHEHWNEYLDRDDQAV